MSKNWIKYSLVSGFVLLLLHLLFTSLFFIIQQESFFNSNNKQWSHRGVGLPENSIESTKQAIKKNYQGIEIDVWFQNNNLVVSHDRNSSDSLVPLDVFFKTFPTTNFWIDLKNLSLYNVFDVKQKLLELKKKNPNFIVESKNAIPLAILSISKINSCLWLQPLNVPTTQLYFSKNGIKELYSMNMIFLFKFNAISMPLKIYDNPIVINKYKHLNIHLWFDNSIEDAQYKKVAKMEEVKIILDDDELY